MKKLFLFVFALLMTQIMQAQWEEDFRLTNTADTSFLTYTFAHSIACKGDTVHVVWYEKIDGNWDIFYIRSTDGGNYWEGETRLTDTETGSKFPTISVAGSSVYVAWEESIDGNREIFFIRSADRGSNWEEPVRLTYDPLISYSANIATAGPYVHLAYVKKDFDLQTWEVHYMYSPDGGVTWSNDTWLSSLSTDAYAPTIAVSGSYVHVGWHDDSAFTSDIYYRRSPDNGLTWDTEQHLTNTPEFSRLPTITAEGSYVYIAWQDDRTGYSNIFLKSSLDNGNTWGDDKQVTIEPTPSNFPHLAYSNSVLHLVWQNSFSGFSDIYYNYSTDGGMTWNQETLLNEISWSSLIPSIDVSGSALHVVWYDYRDFNYEIYYKRNPTGGMVGFDERLRAESLGLSVYPNPAGQQLTVDSWQSSVVSHQSDLRIEIVDLFGRKVKSITQIPSLPHQIDISGLPDGIYILKMTDEEGNESAVKFIKRGKGYL